ncbi:MAG: hypothetical protein AAFV29_25510, partial [Myxococcota bacterium]
MFLALLSVREIQQISEEIRALRDGQLAAARHVARLAAYGQKRLQDLDGFFATDDMRTRDIILTFAATHYPERVRGAVEDVRAVVGRRITMDVARGDHAAAERARDFRALLVQLTEVAEKHHQLDDMIERLIDRIAARAPVGSVRAELEDLNRELKAQQLQLETLLNRATDGAVARASLYVRGATTRVFAFSVLGLLMGLSVTFLIAW